MAMAILTIVFIVMAVLAAILTVMMFKSKEGKMGTTFFILTAALAAIVTVLNATALPSNYTTQIFIAWAMGVPFIIGLVLKFVVKKHIMLAKVLVFVSLVGGMFGAFF